MSKKQELLDYLEELDRRWLEKLGDFSEPGSRESYEAMWVGLRAGVDAAILEIHVQATAELQRRGQIGSKP